MGGQREAAQHGEADGPAVGNGAEWQIGSGHHRRAALIRRGDVPDETEHQGEIVALLDLIGRRPRPLRLRLRGAGNSKGNSKGNGERQQCRRTPMPERSHHGLLVKADDPGLVPSDVGQACGQKSGRASIKRKWRMAVTARARSDAQAGSISRSFFGIRS